MKRMKKLFTVLMATALVLGMNLTAFATETKAVTGSISVSNPLEGKLYNVYLLFELESSSGDAYLYKVTDSWRDFVVNDTVAKQYLEIYDENYVRTIDADATDSGYTAKTLSDSEKAALAKAAIAYAEENSIAPVVTLPRTLTDGSKSYTVSDLTLGYYAVSSTAGALCSLTTVNPNSPITEKNEQPTVDKKVLEDLDHDNAVDENETWGSSNDAEAGSTIYYKTTISAKTGAHEYILHDRMGEGLTLNKDSIKVTVGSSDLNGYFVDGVVNKELTQDEYEAGYDYYVLYDHASEEDKNEICDFEIHFTETYLAKLTDDTDITVTYSADLNDNAKIYEEGNINTAKLEYGDDNFTETIKTYTYTYMFDIIKTNDQNKVIHGAAFELYRADAAGEKELTLEDGKTTVTVESDPVKLINKGNETYMVADPDAAQGTYTTTITAGDVTIKGLDVGTYYLVETASPTGYNKLDYAIEVKFEKTSGKNTSVNNIGTVENGVYDPESGGIQVINNTGSLLPETGGTGRVLLYVMGSIFTIAAVVIIVTKKRMSVEE